MFGVAVPCHGQRHDLNRVPGEAVRDPLMRRCGAHAAAAAPSDAAATATGQALAQPALLAEKPDLMKLRHS
jgi:hypothetical protein